MTPRYSSDDRTYKIIRFYADENLVSEEIATGLTLEEATAWCEDPETSSSSCTGVEGRARTANFGPWFDGRQVEE